MYEISNKIKIKIFQKAKKYDNEFFFYFKLIDLISMIKVDRFFNLNRF